MYVCMYVCIYIEPYGAGFQEVGVHSWGISKLCILSCGIKRGYP